MRKIEKSEKFIPAQALYGGDSLADKSKEDWYGWGLVIKNLRKFSGMDQSVFGRFLRGYTRAQISRYEKEEAEPPIDFWIKMIKCYGVNLTWALTGEGIPYVLDFQESAERQRFIKWTIALSEKKDVLKDLLEDK